MDLSSFWTISSRIIWPIALSRATALPIGPKALGSFSAACKQTLSFISLPHQVKRILQKKLLFAVENNNNNNNP